MRVCPFIPRLIAAQWEVCHGLGGEAEQCWSDRRGALQGEGTGRRGGEGYLAVVVGGSNTAVLGHTFAQDVRFCVRGCTRSTFSSSVSLHGSPLHFTPVHRGLKWLLSQLRNHACCSLIPLRHFFTTIPPGAEVSRAEDFSLFPSLLFYYRESAACIRERTPCSWSRSWSLTVQPVTGSAHTITAMEYLKFFFVFSCWLKFANSVSSTETPQAPAPIPKGEQKKTKQDKKLSPIVPEIQ